MLIVHNHYNILDLLRIKKKDENGTKKYIKWKNVKYLNEILYYNI